MIKIQAELDIIRSARGRRGASLIFRREKKRGLREETARAVEEDKSVATNYIRGGGEGVGPAFKKNPRKLRRGNRTLRFLNRREGGEKRNVGRSGGHATVRSRETSGLAAQIWVYLGTRHKRTTTKDSENQGMWGG